MGLFGVLGPGYFALHDLGRLLLLQGMFVGLVVGVGGLVFPLITRGEGPSDGTATAADRWARAGHVAAALVLAASFYDRNKVESVAERGGARAVIVSMSPVANGDPADYFAIESNPATRGVYANLGIAAEPDQLAPVSQALYPTPEWETPQHIYEFHPRHEPRIRIDNREIIEARFAAPHEAGGLALGRRLRGYMERCPNGERR